MKKVIKRVLLLIVCGLILCGCCFCTSVVYSEFFRAETINTQTSPDGRYTLYLQQIGSPGWPFGPVTAQVMLKEGKKTIEKQKVEVYNDGGPVWKDQWEIEWGENSVVIVVDLGEMDGNETLEFFYD